MYRLYKIHQTCICLALAYNILFVPFSIALDYEILLRFQFIDYLSYALYLIDSLFRPLLAIDRYLNIFVTLILGTLM